MKKKYVTYAGIVAAVILVGMFIGIVLSSYPFLSPLPSPTTTIDPITKASVDENNMLVLTGVTTLPESTDLSVTLSAVPGSYPESNVTGRTKDWDQGVITLSNGDRNRWEAEFDISDLQPAEYQVVVATYTIGNNYTHVDSSPLVTSHFTLGDENAGLDVIRKRSPIASSFIRINPETAGDNKITGITSLIPDTRIAWSLNPETNGSLGYAGTVLVTNGTNGVNRWSVTPSLRTAPAHYQFIITGNTSTGGTVSATADYDAPSALQSTNGAVSVPKDYISIDALPDIRTNDVYTITGTTSLPAGEGLMMQVSPASFDTNYSFSANAKDTAGNGTMGETAVFSGAMGDTVIVNGNNSENFWSFPLQTYKFSPGVYEINVSNDRFDITNMTMISGNLFSSRIVSVSGDIG